MSTAIGPSWKGSGNSLRCSAAICSIVLVPRRTKAGVDALGPDPASSDADAGCDTAFSTIPGAPAYVSKASRYRAKEPRLGIDVDLAGHNAIQGRFHWRA